MQCEDLTQDLSGVVDGSRRLRRPQRRHVEHCLRCQAEMVQYRKLLRALRTLRSEIVHPGAELLTDILEGLDGVVMGDLPASRSLLSRRRIAYLGGIAAATAAGAVSAIVLTTRTRRARLVS
jgi:hypothetical protein